MEIDIKDIITLDDLHQYVVVSKIINQGKEFYYLIESGKRKNILFCYKEKDSLIEVRDKKIIMELLPIFLKETKKEIHNK